MIAVSYDPIELETDCKAQSISRDLSGLWFGASVSPARPDWSRFLQRYHGKTRRRARANCQLKREDRSLTPDSSTARPASLFLELPCELIFEYRRSCCPNHRPLSLPTPWLNLLSRSLHPISRGFRQRTASLVQMLHARLQIL